MEIKKFFLLKNAAISSLVLMIIAHGMNYFNYTFANDRITYFQNPALGTEAAGKWFAQFYTYVKGYSNVPWLVGVLSIIYMTVAVYITCEVLKLKNTISVWLISGLYTTNVSIITANLYGADDFLFALVMALTSVWVWYQKDVAAQNRLSSCFKDSAILRILVGTLALSICMGEYGSYATAGPTLVILVCLVFVINGNEPIYILKRGLEYILTYGVGTVLYYVILRIFIAVRNVEMQSYLNEDKLLTGADGREILNYIKLAYKNTLNNWRGQYSGNSSYASMPQWMATAFLVLGSILFIILIYENRSIFRNKARILLTAFLLALFPLSAGAIWVFAFGYAHYLMIFSLVYLYVAIVKLAELGCSDGKAENRFVKNALRRMSFVTICLLCGFIYKGILASNVAYAGMEMKYTYSRSIATRMINRIETCEGFDGTESVCLVGHISYNEYFQKPDDAPTYWQTIVGGLGVATERTSFSHIGITPLFLRNIMGLSSQVNVYNANNFSNEDNEIISDMTLFPTENSVKKIGNTIVVKLSESE